MGGRGSIDVGRHGGIHMAEALLEIEGVEVRRGMGIVLSNFSLDLHSGDILILQGINGSGKSTVIETASRLLPLEHGAVKHHGKMTIDSDGRRVHPRHPFGLVLQSNGAIGSETVDAHLSTVAKLCNAELDLSALLDAYGLKHRSGDKIAYLSGGQARKVSVLGALLPAMVAESPTLVIMDEPDSGLDEQAITTLMTHIQSLAAAGHAFLIATHNPSMMAIATHVHDLEKKIEQKPNDAKPHKRLGANAPARWVSTRSAHRYARTTRSGLARNGLTALMVLGCALALGDPAQLPSGLWETGGILAPAFAAGLTGDPTTHLLREHRAEDWWRAQSQTTPAAHGLGLAIGLVTTLAACYIYTGGVDLALLALGGIIGETAMLGTRLLHQSTRRLARPNAVFIRLLLPVFILPWALIVSWASKW